MRFLKLNVLQCPTTMPRTPGLRTLLLYFSHVGVQLRRVHYLDPVSLVNFTWNLTIDLSLLYAYLNLDPFQLDPDHLHLNHCTSKPLFLHLVRLVGHVLYPAMFVANLSYAYLCGQSMIKLLDCGLLYRFYTRNSSQWRWIYIGFIASHFVFFFLFYSDKIFISVIDSNNNSTTMLSLAQALRYGCLFACLYQYWACAILHYVHYAFDRLLDENIDKLTVLGNGGEKEIENLNSILTSVRELASISDRLNALLSFPMTVFLVLNTANTVLFVAMSILCSPVIGLLLHALVSALYLGYLSYLSRRITRKVAQLARLVKESSDDFHREHQYSHKRTTLRRRNSYNHQVEHVHHQKDSQRIRAHYEIDHIYGRYFSVRLFRLGHLDVGFLLQMGAFMLQYIVLITQTN